MEKLYIRRFQIAIDNNDQAVKAFVKLKANGFPYDNFVRSDGTIIQVDRNIIVGYFNDRALYHGDYFESDPKKSFIQLTCDEFLDNDISFTAKTSEQRGDLFLTPLFTPAEIKRDLAKHKKWRNQQ